MSAYSWLICHVVAHTPLELHAFAVRHYDFSNYFQLLCTLFSIFKFLFNYFSIYILYTLHRLKISNSTLSLQQQNFTRRVYTAFVVSFHTVSPLFFTTIYYTRRCVSRERHWTHRRPTHSNELIELKSTSARDELSKLVGRDTNGKQRQWKYEIRKGKYVRWNEMEPEHNAPTKSFLNPFVVLSVSMCVPYRRLY